MASAVSLSSPVFSRSPISFFEECPAPLKFNTLSFLERSDLARLLQTSTLFKRVSSQFISSDMKHLKRNFKIIAEKAEELGNPELHVFLTQPNLSGFAFFQNFSEFEENQPVFSFNAFFKRRRVEGQPQVTLQDREQLYTTIVSFFMCSFRVDEALDISQLKDQLSNTCKLANLTPVNSFVINSLYEKASTVCSEVRKIMSIVNREEQAHSAGELVRDLLDRRETFFADAIMVLFSDLKIDFFPVLLNSYEKAFGEGDLKRALEIGTLISKKSANLPDFLNPLQISINSLLDQQVFSQVDILLDGVRQWGDLDTISSTHFYTGKWFLRHNFPERALQCFSHVKDENNQELQELVIPTMTRNALRLRGQGAAAKCLFSYLNSDD